MPLYQLILNIIFGIVGVAGVIALIIYITIKVLEKCVIEKYKNKLDKDLEDFKKEQNKEIETLKAKLGKKNHISQARFDKEFLCYQELSECFITVVYDVKKAVWADPFMCDGKENYIKFIEDFYENQKNAEKVLKRYAPFISKDIFKKYENLNSVIKESLKLSDLLRMVEISKKETPNTHVTATWHGKSHEREELRDEVKNIEKLISNLFEEITDYVRDYLQNLVVIE